MKNVLVIEDDNIMLKAIGNILNRGGYGVLSANNGKAAFDLVDTADYDVVITDLMLPYANGLEIVSRIRNDASKKHVGIIVVSSMGHEDMVTEAFSLGADDYLKKPIMAGELASRIKKLLASKNLLKSSPNTGNSNPGNIPQVTNTPLPSVHRQILQPADDALAQIYTPVMTKVADAAVMAHEEDTIVAAASDIINKTNESAVEALDYTTARQIVTAPEEYWPANEAETIIARTPAKLSTPPKAVDVPVNAAMRVAGKYEKFYFNAVMIAIVIAVIVLGILMRNTDPNAF